MKAIKGSDQLPPSSRLVLIYRRLAAEYAPLQKRVPFQPPFPLFLLVVSVVLMAGIWMGVFLLLGGIRLFHAWRHFLEGAWEVYTPTP